MTTIEKNASEVTLKLGVHVSISRSLDRAVDRALERGCKTFQIFTRNPRGWRSKDLDSNVVEAFKSKLSLSGISPVFAHMPYLPNLASPEGEIYSRSVDVLVSEVRRCEHLNIPYLVIHLGSHRGSGIDNGIQRVAKACLSAINGSTGGTAILLENTAGSKNGVGGTFEEISSVMDAIGWNDRVRLCFDTCHAFVAGYELRTINGLSETLKKIDQTVGLSRLELVHLNDSKGERNSRLDRHEHIGLGGIGEEGFRKILGNRLLGSKPLILETPMDGRRDDIGNMAKVREIALKSVLWG